MATATAPWHEAGTFEEKRARLRLLDTDIHNELPGLAVLKPYLASTWHPWLEDGGPAFATRGVTHVGSGRMDDAVNEEDNLCAGDPAWVVQQLIVKYRVDLGILTGTMYSLNQQRDWRFMTALAGAINEWLLDRWVRPHPCFKGSIVLAAQEPEGAAREIHRHGDDPGMVQVLVGALGGTPYGQKAYWPIYRAAVEHGLPIGVHPTADVGNSGPQIGVGWYSSFLEHHTDHSNGFMAQMVSLICEGVFEEFPTLKFALIEGGFGWVPYVMGRLDRMYPALKREVPHLRKLPSEYVREHFYYSTQPIEEPRESRHLLEMLAMVDGDSRVMFASDYPHWDFDNPLTVLHALPAETRRRICVENVLDCYGPRLLEPSVR
jgi:predicted TIM-barrel fold metal-dependent hydrolase